MNDGIVTAADVLAALNELRQRGATPVLEELEKIEPTLIEELLNGVSALHKDFSAAALSAKQLRRLVRQSETNALTIVLAMRSAYRRLIEADAAGPADTEPQTPPGDQPSST